MKITIKIFAGLREFIPDEFNINVDNNCTVEQLKKLLIKKFPEASKLLNSSRFVVNEEFVDNKEVINKNATVYIIPPVSGG
ncbi:MoaD/ThiS family protein [Rosettibacter firmus]|uniref:MoaD/ThiS family protein n=1 Tax=Rosettibacter firmus TaxID=3111522 RepID=UPI00336C0A3B